MRPAILVGIVLAGTILLTVACRRGPDIPGLPETSVLLGRDQVALVRVEYARLHDRPDVQSPVRGHARFGDTLTVSDRTADEQWFRLESPRETGWVHNDDLELYDALAQALNARRRLQRGGSRP